MLPATRCRILRQRDRNVTKIIRRMRSGKENSGGSKVLCLRSSPQEKIGGYEEGEDHGNDAIHGEECSVELGEIVSLYERMFVDQQKHHGDYAGSGKFAKSESRKQGDQKQEHNEMECARDPKSRSNTDVAGNGVESGVAIELEILTSIENIKAGDPEGDGRGEQQDTRVEGPADGDPCGGRSNAESEAQDEMREARESLGVGVKQQDGQRHR